MASSIRRELDRLLQRTYNIQLDSRSDAEMTNFSEFNSSVKTNGFSLNNFYDVIFEFRPGSELYTNIFGSGRSRNSKGTQIPRLMRLYADECTLPGIQVTTGEYRINNTPLLKYSYGSVFSESNFSFIMDANSEIKKVFDSWTSFIYGYSVQSPNDSRFRARYRDDYAIDIIIIKFEKPISSKNNMNGSKSSFKRSEIIPDIKRRRNSATRFYKAKPVYSARLFKAFPSNISSVPLNSGASSLNKLSVSFEFESYTTSALTGSGSALSGIIVDAVNG
jgi:hypothetical protein